MEKRAVLAIILSVLVLLIFRYVEERRIVQEGPPEKAATARPPAATLPPPPIVREERGQRGELREKEELYDDKEDTASVATKVIVQGELYRAVLDSRGALLTSWELMKYRDGGGSELEMVAAGHDQEGRPYPGGVVLEDAGLTQMANGEHYEVSSKRGIVDGEVRLRPPASVTMRLRRRGLTVEKRYDFEAEKYLVHLSVSVKRDGSPAEASILIAEDVGSEKEQLEDPLNTLQVVFNNGGEVDRGQELDRSEREGNIYWVGLEVRYFAVIAMVEQPLSSFDSETKPITIVGLDGESTERTLIRVSLPAEGTLQSRFYIGPKEQEALSSIVGADLSQVIDFGWSWFAALVYPLLFSLKYLFGYVHNYGLAIVLLTLILSILLFPIRFKQMRSMKKMSALQPQVKAIQEKYKRYKKTDPKRAEMNQEVMGLYKQHKVNPLGGCLPLLLQMPLLFAFYRLLASSIELRHAPFLGWIQDLSAKDPYYVLPLLMGLTMFISQKMTPMAPTTDPTQAKVMMMMPVFFTWLFLSMSSGLNLYFLCSNIFQVGFQKLSERFMGEKGAALQKTKKKKKEEGNWGKTK